MSRRGIALGDAAEEVIKRVQTAKMLAITLSADVAMMVAGLLSGCTSGASSSLQPAYSPSAQSPFPQASAMPVAAASRSADYQLVAEARDRRKYAPPGKLVSVGSWRLHVLEASSGSPAVVPHPQ